MKEEKNNFNLDVDAEKQAVAPSLENEQMMPSELVHPMQDIPFPELSFYTPTESFKKTVVSPQLATQTLQYSVKVDAEEAYLKAEETASKLNAMAQGMKELQEGIQSNWLPFNNKDDFEERVTVEPVNLIFDARKDRMSQRPKWG